MSATRRITMTFSLLLIVCLVGSVLLVRRLGQLRPQATLTEVLYVPSPKVLKRLSLG
jgi:predicted LPLAT superfamily acyltransferase